MENGLPEQGRAPVFQELDEAARRELWASLALRHTPGLGARRLCRLLKYFGSAYAAVEAANSPESWKAAANTPLAESVRAGIWRTQAREEWESLRNAPCGILLWTNPLYPDLLRELPDAPALLYCRGDVALLRAPMVAVVGSRGCTQHGLKAARNISYGLARRGVTVVSGLAKGIDRIAHLAALRGVGSSVAVLGAGLDSKYPLPSVDAREALLEKGLLLSEYAPGVVPRPEFFPIRNRIISGLSLAVVVVEAATRSGSLVTARLALEQGRDVYAVPGPTEDPASLGCQELVRQGARAVFTAEDVLANLLPELERYILPAQPFPTAEECDVPLDEAAPEQITGQISEQVPGQISEQTPEQIPAPASVKPTAPPVGTGPVESPAESSAGSPDAASPTEIPAGLPEEARVIYQYLCANPAAHVDEICRRCGLDVAGVSRHVLQMEIGGFICQLPGMRYKIIAGPAKTGP